MVTVPRTLRTLEQIEAVADQWRRLELRCHDPMTYFQTYDWCHNWIARYGQDERYAPHIVTLWRDEALMAVWPLAVEQRGGLRQLMTLGNPHTQYCGMLADPELDDEADLKPMAMSTLQQMDCDVAVFRSVLEGSLLSRVLSDLKSVEGAANTASMLDLSVYSSSRDYTEHLGKLQRRNRNRRRNHLARRGALEFSVIWPDSPEFSALVMRCAELKQQWLSELGLYSSGFAMGDLDRFLAGLSGDPTSKSGACLSVLRVDGVPVALELGFIRQGHYYAFMGGFDWSLRALSPGKVQMDLTVCWLIDQGISSYDLLTNAADYKKSWSSRSIDVTCRAQALTWKGEIYIAGWLSRLRPALKDLRKRIPELMRGGKKLVVGSLLLLLYV